MPERSAANREPYTETRHEPEPTARRRVVLVSNMLGIGGTEKGLINDALNLPRDRWDIRVVGVWDVGERAGLIEQAGIHVDSADRDPDRLARLFEGADVVHVHRQGSAEPLVPAAARAAGVPVLIETNVFGQRDRSPDSNEFACHLFVSKFCLMRYRRMIGDFSPGFHLRHRTQHHGLDLATLRRDMTSKNAAKRALGLDPQRPVVGRVGRAADGKWRNLLVDMVPTLLRLVPDAQVMFVGCTPAKKARLQRHGILDRCVLPTPTVDDACLASYYAACDVFVTAAEIGEAGAVALTEAMACGLPVVTCSTPWADNCQIEFVDHGSTGYIANHPRPFAEAVAELLLDSGRRNSFGAEGRARIEARACILPNQLDRLYQELLAGPPDPQGWWDPGPAEIDAFPEEYEQRLGVEYSTLTRRERAEMRCVRAAEHWREAARHVRAHMSRAGVQRVQEGVAVRIRRARKNSRGDRRHF